MALNRLVPLLLLFIVLAILGFIGYVVYSIVMDVKSQTEKKMEKKHLTMSRKGMTVGVKELKDEDYKDRSQSVFVDILKYGMPGSSKSDKKNSEPNSPSPERRKPYRTNSSRS